ncbi:hypothetical protein [Isoptericola sp. AK164]|uniref:hypothetical protein n=1 Tax=Isoptericola sp. AK164 TaxID=3024246 RepID=UPI00241862E4|nr:hypothetical protein [Isoptericola sp. AK164]
MAPAERWDADLTRDGRAQITASRARMLWPLAAAAVFLALGVAMVSDEVRPLSVAVVVVFAVGVGVLLWRVVRPVRLVVTRDGVRYRRLELPWDDVVAVHERSTGANRFVLLQITDEAAARLGSQHGVTRRLLRNDDDTCGKACVEVAGPFDHHDELVTWLEAVRARSAGSADDTRSSADVEAPESADPPH